MTSSGGPEDVPSRGTLNREGLEAAVRELGYGHRPAGQWVEAVLAVMLEALVAGDDVKVPGLGRFAVAKRAPRLGRNLLTQEVLPVVAHRTVVFRASASLNARLTDAWGTDEQG